MKGWHIGAVLAVIAALAIIFILASGSTGVSVPQFNAAASVPSINITGISLLGLSNVAVFSNNPNLAGSWWLATLTLGGSQGLSYSQSAPSSAFNPNGSYLSKGQNNMLNIRAVNNQIQYALQNSGTPIDKYFITNLSANGQPVPVAFNTCTGAFPGSYAPTTLLSTQDFSADCLSGTQQTYTNWANECIKLGGKPFVVAQGLNGGTAIAVQLSGGLFGLTASVPIGTQMRCQQLVASPYAVLYTLSPGAPNSTVSVSFNSNTSIVSTARPVNATDPNMIVSLLPGSNSNQFAPSETEADAVLYSNNTFILDGAVNPSQITSLMAQTVATYNGKNGNTQNLTAFQSYLNTQNSGIEGSLYPVRSGPFAYATVIPSTKGNVPTYVVINDPTGQYTRPTIQLLIKTGLVGLYLGVPQLQITNFTINPFLSSTTGTATVSIKNTGGASGGYTAYLSTNASYIGIQPSATQGSIGPSQSGTAIFSITAPGLFKNYTQFMTATVCPTYAPNNCTSKTIQFGIIGNKVTNQAFNTSSGKNATANPSPTGGAAANNATEVEGCLPPAVATASGCMTPLAPQGISTAALLIIATIIIIVIVIIILVYYAKKKR